MELASKSNEIFPADDFRPLSDIEIDGVSGGLPHLLIGAVILLAAAAIAKACS